MCPSTLQLYIAILLVVVLFVVIRRELFRRIADDYEVMRRIVEAPERRDTFSCTHLSGIYRGRKVTLMCFHFDQGDSSELCVELKNIPNPQGKFLISYPRPTANTIWKGNKVFHSRGGKVFQATRGPFKCYTESELVMIFDELSQGASVVESGAMSQ